MKKSPLHDVEIKDTILVRNQHIPVVTRYLPQINLKFFPDNPRIYSIVRSNGNDPTQEEIYRRLVEMEHVRQLARDIKRNGGLIDPLLVRDGSSEVLEGNSRLAAYRFLSKSEAVKWAYVKCTVLPKDTSEPLIFAILGQHHVKGKKSWAKYEQAGFVYRRFKHHKIDLETVANEIGLPQSKVKQLIDTYQFMVDHDQVDVDRWSFFEEYLKSSKIRKARQQYPDLDELVVEKIESGEIPRAVDLRDDLPLVCAAPTKCLKKFATGEMTFAEAVEVAKEAGATNLELKRLSHFRMWVVKPEVEKAMVDSKGQVHQKIVYELEKLSSRIQALRKKLG